MKIPIPFASRAIVVRVEPHPRTPIRLGFRPRTSVRGLMVIVAAVAVVIGGYRAYQRSEERRLFRYFDQTERRLLREAELADGRGQAVEASKARFFAGEAARDRSRFRP